MSYGQDGALWSTPGQSARLKKRRAEAVWKKQENGQPEHTDEESPNASSGSGSDGGSNEFFVTRRDERLEGEKRTSKKTSR
jgi:hypothetical protein